MESCALCACCEEIEWSEKRNALRCNQPGNYNGRVTHVFAKRERSVLEGMPKPAWCKFFVRAGE